MSWDAGVVGVGVAAIAAFAVAFHFSGLIGRARASAATSHEAMTILRDKTLDDLEKERRAQRAAVALFGQFIMITLVAAGVLAVPLLVMWAGDRTGLAAFDAVYDFLLSWEVLIGATVVLIAIVWLARRR